jgi:hypothetical protein
MRAHRTILDASTGHIMATNAGRRPTPPPDVSATAQVAVGRQHRRPGWGLVVLVLIAVVVIAVLLPTAGPSPETSSAPPPTAPDVPPPAPFMVTVDVTTVSPLDNDGLFGRDVTAPPDRAVHTAALEVEDAVQTYLNAAFVDADTRFTARPLAGLLAAPALEETHDVDLAGLGAVGIAVERVEAEPVSATARVLTNGGDVAMVQVRYDARAQIVGDDGRSGPLRQRATMLFVPEAGRWRAEAVDAELELPPSPGEAAR